MDPARRYTHAPMSQPHAAGTDVVIPLYNGAAYVEGALRSVLEGSMLPRRIIVVDDGSSDEGPSLVKAMAKEERRTEITLIRQANQGPNAARETGRRFSGSPLIAFLDADDEWMPRKLEAQVDLMQRSGAGLVYCGYRLIDKDGRRILGARIVPPKLRGQVFDELLKENRISGSASAVLIRRSTLDAAGAFDSALRGSEDLDMWLRIARISAVDYVDEDLVRVRRHAGNAQMDHAAMLQNMIRFYGKWIDEARTRPVVMRHWGHLIAEFALRLTDQEPVVDALARTFTPAERSLLFARAGGSFRLYLLLKRISGILGAR